MSCDPFLLGTITSNFVGLFSSDSADLVDNGSKRLADQMAELTNEYRSMLNSFFLQWCTANNRTEEELFDYFKQTQSEIRTLIQLNSVNFTTQLAMEKIEIIGVYGLFFIIFIYLLFL